METLPEVARQLARAERSKRRLLSATPLKASRKARVCVPHFKNTPVCEGDTSSSTIVPWFYVNKSGALTSRTVSTTRAPPGIPPWTNTHSPRVPRLRLVFAD